MSDSTAAKLDPIIALERRFCANNYNPLPVVLVRGAGVHVWDSHGRCYLDMMSAYSALSHGHSHPRLVAELRQQAETLAVTSRAFYTDRLAPFLERACTLLQMDRALPMNSGAEAVETALKAARKWAYQRKGVAADRAEIIACEGNFHGRTLGAIALSTETQYRDGFGPFMPGVRTVAYGDAQALRNAITDHTAAFLVEPIQGEAGIRVPPDGYLAECAKICKERNVLFIADEIQTGLGRTGRLLACDHENVKPDAVLLGKALGGGLLPVSLLLAREDVMNVFRPGDHGSTFGGTPIAAAVALEALNVLVEERLIDSPLIKEVRGRGLLIGVDFHASRIRARDVAERLMTRGILTKDTHGTVLRFAPPLIIERVMLDQVVQAFRQVLRECEEPATQ